MYTVNSCLSGTNACMLSIPTHAQSQTSKQTRARTHVRTQSRTQSHAWTIHLTQSH